MLKIREVAAHRNGSFGEPFHVVRFEDDRRPMVGIVFEGEGRVAVLDSALTLETVEFGTNSWRCEDYERELRAAVAEYERACFGTAALPAPGLALIQGGLAHA